MKRAILALMFVTAAQSELVTRGVVELDISGTGSQGNYFLETGTFGIAGPLSLTLTGVPCLEFLPACQPGDVLGIGTFADGVFIGGNSATVDGTFYDEIFVGFNSFFRFDTPPFTLTESVIYNRPFLFEGTLEVFELVSGLCVICNENVNGSGVATFSFLRILPEDDPERAGLYLNRIRYEFTEPVPEPGASILVLTACLVALGRLLSAKRTWRIANPRT